jgi:small-conductance mechanosensitive channel
VLGVDNFTETTVTFKARFKTQPAQQYFVGREFRRRLKYALQATGLLDNPPAAAAAKPALPGPTSS